MPQYKNPRHKKLMELSMLEQMTFTPAGAPSGYGYCEVHAMRVPNGWIFSSSKSDSVFVPEATADISGGLIDD